MARKRGLGKGLDALIPAGETPAGGVLQVPIEAVRRNPRQPRSHFDPEALEELAASIREHGVLQPLVVSREAEGDGYVLIAGERRLEAARLAGLQTVPAVVRQVEDQERLELALVENLQRADLNPLEAAEGYRMLAEDFGLSHEAIARRVGKSRAAVTNALRLLKLAPEAQQALREGRISEGHARALLGLSAASAQAAALRVVLERGLSVRETERLVRRWKEAGQDRAKRRPDPEVEALEEELRAALGTRVSLRRGRRGGRLVIYYYSDEELNAIIERLRGEA